MSHDEFVLGYQSGRLGCSVSTLLVLKLFLAGRIREKMLATRLLAWNLGLVAIVASLIVIFYSVPLWWSLLIACCALLVFATGLVHQIGRLVVATAIVDENFYQSARAERALWVLDDGETHSHQPRQQKVVPIRPSRRVQR